MDKRKTGKRGNGATVRSKDSVPKSVYILCFFIFANLFIFNKTISILKNYKWNIYKYLHSVRRSPLVG